MSPSAPPPSNLHNNLFGQTLVGLDLIEHAGDVDEVIDARVREYGNVLYHAQRRTRWRIAGWMDGWRLVDASIMPLMLGAHYQAMVYAGDEVAQYLCLLTNGLPYFSDGTHPFQRVSA
jgi:hypothetical protein